MNFETYLEGERILNEGNVAKDLKRIANKPFNTIKSMFQKEWKKLVDILKDNNLEDKALRIINKYFKTNYRSLEEISKGRPKQVGTLKEDFSHYWDLLKQEAFPTLAFYPALKCWMELDKVIQGAGGSGRIILIYAIFWILLMSGKFVRAWNKWRETNPEEYEKEGARRNPFAI
jgi:hypothetical protein